MSNTGESNGTVVSVTSQGQATIPKSYRRKLGVSAPGRVKFREDDDGRIVVERVRDIRDFRGIASSEADLTAELQRAREREKQREAEAAASFVDEAE